MKHPTTRMRALEAGALYFALVFATGFVLGSVRVPFLVPRLGVRIAELIETPFMLVAVVLSARHVIRRFALPQSSAVRLAVGLVALALLIIAELVLACMIQRQSLAQYIAGRDPISGTVYLAMLALFALLPFLLVRTEASRSPERP